ncbi:MAG: protein kinase [Planctomycetaceae bacterium]|nr:protein kinase [Planctomycetaceae bacterium]
MAIKLTGESFLQFVRQSGLLDAEPLNRILQEFRQYGVRFDDSRALADEFVNRGALTRWQADKILQGKHKGFFLGKYRLLSLLGKGGMSSVYLAEHTLMRRRCALKVLPSKRVNDTSYLGRFHREAQAVAALDHANIVRAYDVDKEVEKDTEIHFLVMEYVEGNSLHDLVTRDGVMSYETACEYIRQSALGLGHAHAAGMVHRDIKPGNLLVDNNGVVKILDLGLARFFNEEDEQSLTVAHDEKVLGTADYLAPEQALDSHRVDARADIYSLGCTLYFLLSAHPPFTEGTLAQRLLSHQTKEPPSLRLDRPDIPDDLMAIIHKMMAKKLPDRYQSAEEVADVMTHWLEQHGSDDWRRKHSRHQRPTGQRPGSSVVQARNVDTVPDVAVVSPTPPVATAIPAPPPVWTPMPTAPSQPAAGVPQSDLASFLSGLDQNPPPVAPKPPSTKSRKAVQAQGPGSGTKGPGSGTRAGGSGPIPAVAAPAAAPVAVAVPVEQQPMMAQPVVAQPVATAAPVAYGQPQQAYAVQEGYEAQPAYAEAVVAEPVASSKLAPAVDFERVKGLLNGPHRWKIIGGGVAVLALLAAAITWAVMGGGPSKKDGLGGEKPLAKPLGAPKKGEDIKVGPEGHFETIREAIDFVAKTYDSSKGDPPPIRVAGGKSYDEAIRLVAKFEYPEAIRVISDGPKPAILAPTAGTDPVVVLGEIDRFTLEGFEIDGGNRAAAIEVRGSVQGLRLKNLSIRNFTKSGVLAKGPSGFFQDGRDVVFEKLRIEGSSASAAGIRFEAGNDLDQVNQVTIRNCRFSGPMAGIVLADRAAYLEIRENLFVQNDVGFRFEGAERILRDVVLGNNTFYKCTRPIVFVDLPSNLSTGLGFYRNLFAGQTGPEVIVEKGYKAGDFAKAFAPMMENGAAGANWNYSTRNQPAPPAANEVAEFFGNAGKWQISPSFASTEPKDATFLTPRTGSPLANVPNPGKNQKPYIGAVSP